MQKPDGDGPRDRGRRSRLRLGLVAVGAALSITLATVGFAAARTDGSTGETRTGEEADGERLHRGPGRHALGAGIHGEFTTRAPDGGYQTVVTQVGEVAEVSPSSITVRSEDGYSRTYSVDDGTMVNAGNDGIADVQQGDEVRVVALAGNGDPRAVDVRDITRTRALRERWAPQPR